MKKFLLPILLMLISLSVFASKKENATKNLSVKKSVVYTKVKKVKKQLLLKGTASLYLIAFSCPNGQIGNVYLYIIKDNDTGELLSYGEIDDCQEPTRYV